jgi:hypothetical protein
MITSVRAVFGFAMAVMRVFRTIRRYDGTVGFGIENGTFHGQLMGPRARRTFLCAAPAMNEGIEKPQ